MRRLRISLATLLCIASPALAAGNTFDEAVKAYNARSYAQALTLFDSICTAEPNNETAHYYLALSYQALHRRLDAMREYQWVVDHGTNATLKNNASVGLRGLSGHGGTTSSSSADAGAAPTANSYFFTQLNDPKWNRNASKFNRNCGPTCLAMIFKRFNKFPPGFARNDPEYLIEATRILVTGSQEDRSTKALELRNGAVMAGYKAELIDGVDKIDKALSDGKMVIALGNPFQPGAYGYRVGYQPFKNGHFILVTGKAGDQFVVNDPIYLQGPINLSSGELAGFISWTKGGNNCVAVGP